MDTFVKSVIVILLLSTIVVASEEIPNKLSKDEVWTCVRWRWTSDSRDPKVICIEWAKKDCSTRLYKDICKLGG